MYYRPRDVRQLPEKELEYCLTTPRKAFYFYFMNEQLVTEEDFYERVSPTFSFTNDVLNARTSDGEWLKYSTCFEAERAATHFALSLDRGNFEIEPPCVIDPTDFLTTFHEYHVDIDQLQLTPFPVEIDTSLGLCENNSIYINLYDLADTPVREGIEFLWSDGYEGAERTLSEEGIFEIEARLECGSFPMSIQLISIDCSSPAYVPTAFSPDGNGQNDEFQVFMNSEFPIVDYQLQVFDRWGGLVFQSTDIDARWDGNFTNNPLPSGTYVWQLSFKVDLPDGQQLIHTSGQVNMVR
jgi:gliding motility-associated-like protein